MAPGLVTPEKAERGKLPTDVWWHTIVPPTGREKTGYPTQKPEGIAAPDRAGVDPARRLVLDFFAGSGTLGAVAAALGRPLRADRQEPRGDRGHGAAAGASSTRTPDGVATTARVA